MPGRNLTPTRAGRPCIRDRHRLNAARNTTTQPDGKRVHQYWCEHPDCPRYGTPVATRPAIT